MPSDAAVKLAERIVGPVYLSDYNGISIRSYENAVANRAVEVARVAAIIDAGLAEAHDAACEACAKACDGRREAMKEQGLQTIGQTLKSQWWMRELEANDCAAACRELKKGAE